MHTLKTDEEIRYVRSAHCAENTFPALASRFLRYTKRNFHMEITVHKYESLKCVVFKSDGEHYHRNVFSVVNIEEI